MTETHPRVAAGAVIMRGGKVLLVKRKNPPSKGRWAIPGGKVFAGERLREAVKREIREEAGIEIDVGEVVHVFDVIERNKGGHLSVHYVIIDFEARYRSGELRAGDDALEVRWVAPEEIDALDVNETSRGLLKDKFGF
jgi:ADP-ribose pyrophosphatase